MPVVKNGGIEGDNWCSRPSLERIEQVVFQAIGAASMCWSETPMGVFESTRAKQIGDDLVAFINEGKVPEWLS
jgi:hypothetical protein